jgi:hypothetical protein
MKKHNASDDGANSSDRLATSDAKGKAEKDGGPAKRRRAKSGKHEPTFRGRWRRVSLPKKIEIAIGIIAACGTLAYVGVSLWGNLQAKQMSERIPPSDRAWLTITEIKGVRLPDPTAVVLKGQAEIPYSFVVDNTGRSVARRVHSRSGYSFGTEPVTPADCCDKSTPSYQDIFPNRPIESYATRNPIVLRRGEDVDWIAGKVHLYLYLFVEYETVVDPGVVHHTNVCAVYLTPMQQLFCHTGNEAD